MSPTPILEAIDPTGSVAGWRYLWLKYVSGFAPGVHCARCLVGPYSKLVGKDMPANHPLALAEAAEYRQIYLCGVASSGGWAANLHLACEPAPGETAEVTASTGTVFRIRNARRLEIPPLEPRFAGRARQFTTCRNWQFGVAYYGPPATRTASDQPAPRSGLLAR